ncbi:MAG: shikimate kinase [Actinobacteria bacterium]|nr:shikimate kinase [Actinomycetota bacterium]
MDAEAIKNVALIGFMGSGKSTVGYLLARYLHMEFVDLDEVIASEAGMSINEIFAVEGEEGFREREGAALQGVLRSGSKVLSCGGGLVLDRTNVDILRRSCRVFLLRISPERAVERLSGSDCRPLIAEGDLDEKVRVLMHERSRRYLEAAHEVVEADAASPQELAEELAERWLRYVSDLL